MHERRDQAKGGSEAAGACGSAKANAGSNFRSRSFLGQHKDSGEVFGSVADEGSGYSSSNGKCDGYSCLRPLVY